MWGTTATNVTSKFYFFSNLTDFIQHLAVLDDPTEELYSIVSLREIKSHNGWDFPWKFYQNARRDHKWRFAQKTKGTQLSSAAAQSTHSRFRHYFCSNLYGRAPRGPRGVIKSDFFFQKWKCWVFALRLPQKGTNFEKPSRLEKNVKKYLFS